MERVGKKKAQRMQQRVNRRGQATEVEMGEVDDQREDQGKGRKATTASSRPASTIGVVVHTYHPHITAPDVAVLIFVL